ncbi:MAG TPA: FAD/NAD(P)-binding oxidoreductase, partial [Pseudonocardiaceae bacterium]|nr:FAD/NAD(P)-binding oxidoreductase [Pseudonocardiaceae bacterium]
MAASAGTVVIGGSVAAVTAVGELRRLGYAERIVLVSDESVPPYARPPLSKGVLTGRDSVDSVTLPTFGDDIDVRLGVRADSLDLTARRVRLADGDDLPFDSLMIATGARARTLDGENTSRELVLRTLDDCLDLRDQMARASSVLVVG